MKEVTGACLRMSRKKPPKNKDKVILAAYIKTDFLKAAALDASK